MHAHEEDSLLVKVYRPSSYPFSASRFREGFELLANKKAKLIQPGMNDIPVEIDCTWKIKCNRLIFKPIGAKKCIVYKILFCDPEQIKLTRN